MPTIRDRALAEMQKNLEADKVSTMVNILSQMQSAEEYYKNSMEVLNKAAEDVESATSSEDLMLVRQRLRS